MVGALTRLCYGYMPPRQRPHLGQHSKNVPLSLTSPYALGKLLLFSDLGTLLSWRNGPKMGQRGKPKLHAQLPFGPKKHWSFARVHVFVTFG